MKRLNRYDEMLFSGKFYESGDLKLLSYQHKCVQDMRRYNKIPSGPLGLLIRTKRLNKLFGKVGPNSYIEPPIYANFGGKNVFIGNNFYSNSNLTLVDDGKIEIGDNVMIGPNVTICTAMHSLNANDRLDKNNQYNEGVVIGNNVWICAKVTILPGVKIGDNSVIGAGSVVTKDVPANVLAFGNPCKVIKSLEGIESMLKDENIFK